MVSREIGMAYSGLSLRELALIGQSRMDIARARATLRSYLFNLRYGAGTVRILLVNHLRTALDLGMPEQAERLFEALCLFLQDYPEARGQNPSVLAAA